MTWTLNMYPFIGAGFLPISIWGDDDQIWMMLLIAANCYKCHNGYKENP